MLGDCFAHAKNLGAAKIKIRFYSNNVRNSDTTVRTKGAQPPDALEVLRPLH